MQIEVKLESTPTAHKICFSFCFCALEGSLELKSSLFIQLSLNVLSPEYSQTSLCR